MNKFIRGAAAVLVAALALTISLPLSHALDPATELSFPKLAAANCSQQWKLTLSQGNLASPDFIPINCSSPVLGACTATNPPLMQDSGDLVRIAYNLSNPRGPAGSLQTWEGAQPTWVEFKMCFALTNTVDRAWRKKNKPYPRVSQNCPFTLWEGPFNGTTTSLDLTTTNSGVQFGNFNNLDEIPTSTWFTMMWVYCGESVCAFESTEGAPGNATAVPPVAPVPGNFFQTQVEMGITTGMTVAAIVLSLFGPVFFVGYYIADNLYYRKNGRPLSFL